MTIPARASAPSRRSIAPTPSAEAKLALTEFLLVCEDFAECAERSVEWLGRHTAAKQILCAAIDADLTRLVGLTGYGIPSARVGKFSVSLAVREHPLVVALAGTRPVELSRNGFAERRALPLEAASFLVGPLHGLEGRQRTPVGLLLASPVSPVLARELSWLGELLGQRLLRLRSSRTFIDAARPLRRERGLLYSLINAVPDPITLTDTEGRMVIANSRAELLFATRERESEGRRRAVSLNNMLFSSALGQSAVREAGPERRELLLVDPQEGSDLLFELLSTVVGDPSEGTGIVSILRNVTDLRRATEEIEENYRKLRLAEAEVRGERDRLDLIIDSVADPIVVTDPAGNIVLMNAPAERLFTLREGLSPEGTQRVRANDANFTSFVSNLFFGATELRYGGGISLVDPKTGAIVPVEALSGKILSDQGEVTGIVTILHDRTEALEKERLYEQLKRASEELEHRVREATAELVHQNELLRRQAIELEQASALKTQFLANMSHEFRTPLNAILGYTSLLLHGVSGELTSQQRENLSRVDSNARHLLSLISGILDIARIETGRMPLNLGEFTLPDLVAEVIAELEPIIARSKPTLRTDLAAGLPPLRSDRQKVKQILVNLLTNALKFTPEGSVTVSATSLPSTKQVAIAVADTGIGIAPSDQEKVFEDFRQADASPTREYGGAGLGLSICRRLAAMLGGQITLRSKLGQGSTFSLLLPVRLRRQ